MANSPSILKQRPLRIFVGQSSTISGGGSLSIASIDAGGFTHVRGFITNSTGVAAAGFPRVRQSEDGTNFDITEVIPQDATQPNFTYTLNILIIAKFISVEFTAGGGGAANFRADVRLVPVG